MNAIETTGTVDEQSRLRLDRPLPITGPSRVRVIILMPEPEDIEEDAWTKAAATNPAFDFLKEEAENAYTRADGKPFDDHATKVSSPAGTTENSPPIHRWVR